MLTRLPLRLARPLCAWRHWSPRNVPLNVLAPRSRWRWALPCCLASWVLLPKATGAERNDFGRDRRDRRLVQCEEHTVKLHLGGRWRNGFPFVQCWGCVVPRIITKMLDLS